jgi:aquaporin Z/aquaporin NIP
VPARTRAATTTTSRGLYGSDTGTSVARTATAELVGTFLLVLTGISVAIAALLDRAIAGGNDASLAVVLAFGLVLGPLVGGVAAALLYDRFVRDAEAAA